MNKNKLRNILIGKFDAIKEPNFVVVEKKYHTRNLMYLQKETLTSFIKMKNAAKRDNIQLSIISGTRNFNDQKLIWEKKYLEYKLDGMSDIKTILKIMKWSAMPSTSRHHWGTDIDLNGFDDYFHKKNLKSVEEYKWLKENARRFGFCEVYSKKEKGKRTTGYNEEKWHWSYMPIANEYLGLYQQLISYKDITGFSGSQYAKKLDIINNYVLGISNI